MKPVALPLLPPSPQVARCTVNCFQPFMYGVDIYVQTYMISVQVYVHSNINRHASVAENYVALRCTIPQDQWFPEPPTLLTSSVLSCTWPSLSLNVKPYGRVNRIAADPGRHRPGCGRDDHLFLCTFWWTTPSAMTLCIAFITHDLPVPSLPPTYSGNAVGVAW
jgi:hypothetical protein